MTVPTYRQTFDLNGVNYSFPNLASCSLTFVNLYRSSPKGLETFEFIRDPIKTIESLTNIGYIVTASES